MSWLERLRKTIPDPETAPDQDGPVSRGVRAAGILQDSLVREALKAAEANAIKAFRMAGSDEALRRAQAQIQAVEEFARYLRGIVEKGKAASAELERGRAERERLAMRRSA